MKVISVTLLVFLLPTCLIAQSLYINEFMSGNAATIADEDDDYSDWVEIYNCTSQSVNLNGYGISDEPSNLFKWTFPAISIVPFETLLVFASGKDRWTAELHTNFKIDSEGEILTLTEPGGAVIDQIFSGYIPCDISRGRACPGGDLLYFGDPTPGLLNTTPGYSEISSPPVFSPERGFYSGSVAVTLQAANNAVVRYTLDGSDPDEASEPYIFPIAITSTTSLRARAFEPGKLFSEIVTHSYIFYDAHDLAVISLTTDPENLWSNSTGIYVPGPDPGPSPWYPNANYWEEWERPISLEFIEPGSSDGFHLNAGVMICGGISRTRPQKPLAIFTREKYGENDIDYQLFTNRNIHEFTSFVLRNSGNDWSHTMMRDALMQSLADPSELDVQAYRPTIVFINGEYWGIHNLREKQNEEYLESYYGIDTENIDLLEANGSVIEGDSQHYDALIDFLESHDLSVDENYEYVQTQMHVLNFITYQTHQIYCANTDWPGNNIKYWRPRTANGIWRWLLFDTDHGFALFPPNTYAHNTLAFALEPNGPSYPNPPWSTFLMRTLIENHQFKVLFINHFADILNLDFSPDVVSGTIAQISTTIEPEIEAHQSRWGRTLEEWCEEIDELYEFAEHRVDCVRAHIMQEFDLAGMANIDISVDSGESGSVQINTRILDQIPWEGIYFEGIPITVTALPNWGYEFDHWSGDTSSTSNPLTITPDEDMTLCAAFEPLEPEPGKLVITEINYNSEENYDSEDWIEVYNSSGEELDIGGWIFKDSNAAHTFVFPEEAILEPGEIAVVCRDTVAFKSYYPWIFNVYGDFDFGLSSDGELIRIYNATFEIVDSLTYGVDDPWPTQPNGNGPTLELIDPEEDNCDPLNWRASILLHGSPGVENGWVDLPQMQEIERFPDAFELLPCYPNPFNSTTVIRFKLPESRRIHLGVYDLLGREVGELISGYSEAGIHHCTFNAGGDLASGLYLLRLQAGRRGYTRKIVLLR